MTLQEVSLEVLQVIGIGANFKHSPQRESIFLCYRLGSSEILPDIEEYSKRQITVVVKYLLMYEHG